MIGVRVRSTG